MLNGIFKYIGENKGNVRPLDTIERLEIISSEHNLQINHRIEWDSFNRCLNKCATDSTHCSLKWLEKASLEETLLNRLHRPLANDEINMANRSFEFLDENVNQSRCLSPQPILMCYQCYRDLGDQLGQYRPEI